MKKLLSILISCLILSIINVYALGVSFEFKESNGKINLIVKDEDKTLTYDEAINKYKIDEYLKLTIKNKTCYFYKGEEITEDEYEKGYIIENARKYASTYLSYGKYITSTDEMIRYIKNIYTGKLLGEYHLVYSKYSKIDFNKVTKYIKDNYISEIDKNMYTYLEYETYHPMKFIPIYDENEMIISSYNLKITNEEKQNVEDFTKQFVNVFKEKSDIDKILGVYTYLTNTVEYVKDENSNMLEAYVSTYDTLITRKSDCIGLSTTFSYLMESLGIKSYIVDHVNIKDTIHQEYNTLHTYNIVKLDDKWYIVDLTEKSLLKGKDSNLYNESDLEYMDITLNEESFKLKSIDYKLDYSLFNEVIDRINKKQSQENNEILVNNDTIIYYIVTLLILVVLALIIVLFTRKK